MNGWKRTHHLGELRLADAGVEVVSRHQGAAEGGDGGEEKEERGDKTWKAAKKDDQGAQAGGGAQCPGKEGVARGAMMIPR